MNIKNKEFIEKANKIHNNKYDYSLINYVNNRTNIKIICSIHGEFEQIPDKHTNRKQGCPNCSPTKKITHEYFLSETKKKYDNLFKYTNLNFKHSHDYIKIICSKHGEFKEKPYIHLKRNTCIGCKKIIVLNRYIEECQEIHNNKYDYSLVKYTNCYNKVDIICSEHGIFKQALHSHKQGHGCTKCGISIKYEGYNFIEKAIKIHNNIYDYSLVEYKNNTIKVKIICTKHGIFDQQPVSHLMGHGCPKCKSSKGEKQIQKFLDDNEIEYNYQYIINFNNKKYLYDFHLPEHNLYIEYDGEQHFKPVKYFGGLNKFLQRINNDFQKDKYCILNDVNLLRIPYWEIINIEKT